MILRVAPVSLFLVPCLPACACAGGSVRAFPGELSGAWNVDLLVIFNLLLFSALYVRGLRGTWSRAGRAPMVHACHAVAVAAGMGILSLVLLSPLDALGEELASAHMIQHMALMLVVAPLLVLGAPATVLPRGLPPAWRKMIDLRWVAPRALYQPVPAWCLFALTLWGWHHPLMYQAALRDELVHDAQHLSFLVAAFVFWRPVLDPIASRRMHPAGAVLYLFATSLHASVLGIFLALAREPWYADYQGRTIVWGWSVLEDQQLAGLIMWVPACLVYPAIAAACLGAWLSQAADATAGRRASA